MLITWGKRSWIFSDSGLEICLGVKLLLCGHLFGVRCGWEDEDGDVCFWSDLKLPIFLGWGHHWDRDEKLAWVLWWSGMDTGSETRLLSLPRGECQGRSVEASERRVWACGSKQGHILFPWIESCFTSFIAKTTVQSYPKQNEAKTRSSNNDKVLTV